MFRLSPDRQPRELTGIDDVVPGRRKKRRRIRSLRVDDDCLAGVAAGIAGGINGGDADRFGPLAHGSEIGTGQGIGPGAVGGGLNGAGEVAQAQFDACRRFTAA